MMRSLVVKCLVFSVLLVFVLIKIDPFFVNNKSWDVSSFNSFYESDKNSLDIVFIGSSHLNKGVDTYIIDANCKTSSVKLSGGGMTIAQMYYNLKEVLTTQNPNLVVMETYTLIEPQDMYNKVFDKSGKLLVRPFNCEYYKRFGFAKYDEISSIYPDSKLYNMFNSFRFNDVWTNGEKLSASISAKLSLNPKQINQDYNKKLTHITNDVVEKYNDKEFLTKKFLLSKNEKVFLNKIIELSKTENFELLFFTTPILDVYYKKTEKKINKVSSQLNELIKGHDNVKYYDLNKEVKGYDKTRFLPGTVNHNQHLNYKGIVNASNLLSKFIKSNYKFNTDSIKRGKSIEAILYTNKKIEKDSTILGNILGINNFKYRIGDSLTNTISIPNHQKNVSIKGWMFKKDLSLKKSTRKLALKKKNNFIIISEGNLDEKENKAIAKRYGDSYKMTGFQFKFNRNSVEKGKYRIYNIIESDKGEIFIKDMWKWLIIE